MKRLTAARPGTASSSWACFSRREHIIGVSVSDTTAEVTTAIVRVSANSRNMRPTRPDMNNSGMNTAISDTVSEITVKPISLAPFSEASIALSPFSMWRTMFSIITMASSTTKPVPMVSAISDRLSRLKPAKYMMPKLVISDSGSATPAISVARSERRNSSTTSVTSTTLRISVNCTSRTEARMVTVRSETMVRFTPAGIARWTFGISARIWLTTSITLAPG
ncbi:hypothetical protein ACVWZK_005682 [Bradyrhizobium sp. GM0.4]